MSVSILIPIYNVEKYIERCGRSLFEQTYHDIEYIFVNDCTPDNSVEILKNIIQEYPQRKEHIRIISHEKNRGLAAARNTAVDNCQTDFLMHVDSDDFLELDAVEKLVKKQNENDYDIVTGNAMMHYKDTSIVLHENEPTDKIKLIKLYIGKFYNHVLWGRLIRTSLYRSNNIQALEGCNIGEDHQVVPKLFYYAKSFVAINDILYHYDCTNESSYMSQSGDSICYLYREYQNTLSYNVLRVFFDDKEDYSDQVYSSMPHTLNKALHASIVFKKKEIYDELVNIFNSLDKLKLRNNNHKYNYYKLLFINNYYLARLRYMFSRCF